MKTFGRWQILCLTKNYVQESLLLQAVLLWTVLSYQVQMDFKMTNLYVFLSYKMSKEKLDWYKDRDIFPKKYWAAFRVTKNALLLPGI